MDSYSAATTNEVGKYYCHTLDLFIIKLVEFCSNRFQSNWTCIQRPFLKEIKIEVEIGNLKQTDYIPTAHSLYDVLSIP